MNAQKSLNLFHCRVLFSVHGGMLRGSYRTGSEKNPRKTRLFVRTEWMTTQYFSITTQFENWVQILRNSFQSRTMATVIFGFFKYWLGPRTNVAKFTWREQCCLLNLHIISIRKDSLYFEIDTYLRIPELKVLYIYCNKYT